ncbi:MAG TPA: hypothetical protein VL551_27525 [Actinospica sp.]|jgi:hypothetical protein|nr:hypothetical protein [Actinospica sp.]
MSAFIVTKQHIDAMVTGGLPRRGDTGWIRWDDPVETGRTHILNQDSADRAGSLLWQENRISVNHRYHDGDEIDVIYTFQRQGHSPVVVLKLIDCYEYQSCEHPAWKESQAKRLCDQLRKQVISKLPGYDEAPWGF